MELGYHEAQIKKSHKQEVFKDHVHYHDSAFIHSFVLSVSQCFWECSGSVHINSKQRCRYR